MDRSKSIEWIRKYRYVLLILLIGIGLMLLPVHQQTQEKSEAPMREDMESRLESILCRIEGAGEVAVMLTESGGEEIVYQTDGEGADTVLITDAQRCEQGLIRTRIAPVYCGAIVVCAGAERAAVRLAIVEAVADVTGLGTDRITVLKMGQEEM